MKYAILALMLAVSAHAQTAKVRQSDQLLIYGYPYGLVAYCDINNDVVSKCHLVKGATLDELIEGLRYHKHALGMHIVEGSPVSPRTQPSCPPGRPGCNTK